MCVSGGFTLEVNPRHGNSKPFIGCTIGLSTAGINCISHELVCVQLDPT